MMYLNIPDSQVVISRLGFGCARLAAGPELAMSAKLIEAALRQGVTHFDTAPMYGSEELLGAVLGDSKGVTIATKVGIQRAPATDGGRHAWHAFYRRYIRPILGNFPRLKSALVRSRGISVHAHIERGQRLLLRDEIHRELELSLRRLRRSSIDIYLIHEPERFILSEELGEIFGMLKKNGVIRAYGLGFGGPLPVASAEFGTIDQCRYSAEMADKGIAQRATLFHGVLRYGLHDGSKNTNRHNAGNWVAQVLNSHTASAVIFSASSTRQIDRLCIPFYEQERSLKQ